MYSSRWPTQNEFNNFVDILSHFDLFIHFFSFIGLLLCILVFIFVFLCFFVCMLVCFVCFWFCLFVFKEREGERPRSWVSGEDLGVTGEGET